MSADLVIDEVVLRWGIDAERQPPHSLNTAIYYLVEAQRAVPDAYRSSARIDFDPHHDCAGDTYAQVVVTYSRPMTDTEVEQYAAEDAAHWAEQLRQAEERVVYCRAQIAAQP